MSISFVPGLFLFFSAYARQFATNMVRACHNSRFQFSAWRDIHRICFLESHSMHSLQAGISSNPLVSLSQAVLKSVSSIFTVGSVIIPHGTIIPSQVTQKLLLPAFACECALPPNLYQSPGQAFPYLLPFWQHVPVFALAVRLSSKFP